jgi:hypothetical protein
MAEQQEEKKRKKYLLPVILLFAVCLIGAGFAYTAWTENGGNQPSSEYIVLSQNGAGAYQFAPDDTIVYYDTKNVGTGTPPVTPATYYGLTEKAYFNDPIENAIVVQLGKTFQILTNKVQTGSSYDPLVCQVTNDFELKSGWDVYLVIETKNASGVDQSTTMKVDTLVDNTFTIYPNAASNPTGYRAVTVSVYYGYSATAASGMTSTVPPLYPLCDDESPEGKKLTFTVNTIDHNTPGIELNTPVLKITSTTPVNLTATPTGLGDVSVTWTASEDTHTTFTPSGNTCEITGVSDGRVEYTASITISGVVYQAKCLVIVDLP